MLAVRLPQEIDERLARLSERTGRTKSFYVREALKDHIEDLEDYYLACEVSDRISKGDEAVFSLDDVREELDLEN